MHDDDALTPAADNAVERLLARSFPPGPALSRAFDSTVMSAIARRQRKRGPRFVMIVMLAYWAAASLGGALVLAGTVPAGSGPGHHSAVILAVLGLLAGGSLLLARLAGTRVSTLFFRTIG